MAARKRKKLRTEPMTAADKRIVEQIMERISDQVIPFWRATPFVVVMDTEQRTDVYAITREVHQQAEELRAQCSDDEERIIWDHVVWCFRRHQQLGAGLSAFVLIKRGETWSSSVVQAHVLQPGGSA